MEVIDIKMKLVFTLEDVITSIIRRECLICQKDLDSDLGHDWKLPLCSDHRTRYLMGDVEESI